MASINVPDASRDLRQDPRRAMQQSALCPVKDGRGQDDDRHSESEASVPQVGEKLEAVHSGILRSSRTTSGLLFDQLSQAIRSIIGDPKPILSTRQ